MPYVPVQRDEGRILYQSTMDRAKLMGDTLTNLGETLYKRDEENKAFRAKNSALKQLIATHKDKFGLDEATAKQFLGGDPNKSEKENYLTLASFLEGSVTASNLKKQEDEIKTAEAQRALIFAQSENQKAQAEEYRLKQQRNEMIAGMLGLPTKQSQTPISTDATAGFDKPNIPVISQQRTAAPAAPVTPTTSAAPVSPTETVSVSKTNGAPAPSVVQPPKSLQVFNPAIAEQARRESILNFLSTGEYKDPNIISQRLSAEQRKQEAEQRQLTREQAIKEQSDFNQSQKLLPFGERRVASVKESGTGGFYVLNVDPAQMTAVEKQAMEANTKEEGEIISRIGKTIEQDRTTAQVERTLSSSVNGLYNLLSQDKIDGDALIGLKTSIRSFGKSLGLAIDEEKLANAETARAYFGQLVLPFFNATKGAISDKETALFLSWSPQLGLNKKANLELLSVVSKRIQLNREFEKLGNMVDSGKLAVKNYVLERQKLIEQYDDSLPSVEDFLKASGAPSQAISKTIEKPIVPGEVIAKTVDSALNQGASAASDLFDFLINKSSKTSDSQTKTSAATDIKSSALSDPAVSSSAMVTAARPIDQYRALRPSDVAFNPAALAASQFSGQTPVNRNGQAIPSNASGAVRGSVFNPDPAALEAARKRFDSAIAAPAEQFAFSQSTLSPEAKAIAKRLRDEFDDLSSISEKRVGSSRLTASENSSKPGSLKKKRTITLDEEGIKAILSNPRILVESFGDVMGDTYQRAVRNQATDAEFARNARLREMERQFGISPRPPVRRGR
jgi:hypothetical protein